MIKAADTKTAPAFYMAAATIVSLILILMLPETSGKPLKQRRG